MSWGGADGAVTSGCYGFLINTGPGPGPGPGQGLTLLSFSQLINE
jgi:hypothetical protein